MVAWVACSECVLVMDGFHIGLSVCEYITSVFCTLHPSSVLHHHRSGFPSLPSLLYVVPPLLCLSANLPHPPLPILHTFHVRARSSCARVRAVTRRSRARARARAVARRSDGRAPTVSRRVLDGRVRCFPLSVRAPSLLRACGS